MHDELLALQASGATRSREPRACANALADLYAQALAQAIDDADLRRRTSSPPACTADHPPSPGGRLDRAGQQRRARGREERAYRGRGFPQPGRRRRRPGRAAGAGIPSGDLRRRCAPRDRQHRRHRQRHRSADRGRRARLRHRARQRADRPVARAPSRRRLRHRGRVGAQRPCRRRTPRTPPRAAVFRAAPPKSTGRDLFNAAWLDAAPRRHRAAAARRAGDAHRAHRAHHRRRDPRPMRRAPPR